MTLTQNVASTLKQNVTLEVEGIDCVASEIYAPRLRSSRGHWDLSVDTAGVP